MWNYVIKGFNLYEVSLIRDFWSKLKMNNPLNLNNYIKFSINGPFNKIIIKKAS